MPALSIIIPTLNRYGDLRNSLQDLLRQSFDDFEVLVIDQTDKEQAEEIGIDDPRIRYFWSAQKSASGGRNIGIRHAKGDVFLFVDDDVIITDPDFLHKHMRHYENPEVPGVVGCPLEKSLDQKPRLHRHWMSYRPKVGWLYFPSNYGCFCRIDAGRSNNLSARREVTIAVGGMDENYDKGAHREEADFCLRVRDQFGLFVFDPEAQLVHIGNATGGVRSWNTKASIKAPHHYVGALYFLFKMIPSETISGSSLCDPSILPF